MRSSASAAFLGLPIPPRLRPAPPRGTGPRCSATSPAAVPVPTLDTGLAREAFPILRPPRPPLHYLDSASTTQKPDPVLRALRHYYEHDNANVHRGAHTLAARATDAFESARDKFARFVSAAHRDEVIFTRNATEALTLLAHCWAGPSLQPGDEIILSLAEHHSNTVPWLRAAERTGAVVRTLPVAPAPETRAFDMDAYAEALSGGKTKLVAVSHASHVLGDVVDVAEVARMAHDAGAVVVMDACASAGHMAVDVGALGCDFAVFSGHKMYAPAGVGVLWGRRELLDAMPPFLGGGEMIDHVTLESATYAALPAKFEAGTPAIGPAIALGAAVDFLEGVGMERVEAHERALLRHAVDALDRSVRGVRILGASARDGAAGGAAPARTPVLCFNVDGFHPADLSALGDLAQVALRSGTHDAFPLHAELGVDASARVSLGMFNSRRDVDALVDVLVQAQQHAAG